MCVGGFILPLEMMKCAVMVPFVGWTSSESNLVRLLSRIVHAGLTLGCWLRSCAEEHKVVPMSHKASITTNVPTVQMTSLARARHRDMARDIESFVCYAEP